MAVVMKALIAWCDNLIDEWMERFFRTYGKLGNYPDDRKIKRGTQ